MSSTDDAEDPRYFGCHEGTVVNNLDPEGLGRLRILVEGLSPEEGTPWAYPMGNLGAGSPQRGGWDIPDVGSTVYVWFLSGDPDHPRYLPGHQSRGEEPTAILAAKDEAVTQNEKVEATLGITVLAESEDWHVVADEREGRRRLYINAKSLAQDLETGNALMIEFDREQGVLSLSGIGGLSIRSTGLIDIAGTAIQIAGRKVIQTTTAPI